MVRSLVIATVFSCLYTPLSYSWLGEVIKGLDKLATEIAVTREAMEEQFMVDYCREVVQAEGERAPEFAVCKCVLRRYMQKMQDRESALENVSSEVDKQKAAHIQGAVPEAFKQEVSDKK